MTAQRYSYKRVIAHGHPRADYFGHVLEHVLIAERALGKPLPDGAEVHHADGIWSNNANSNLVICQDKAYHKLLHVRARVLKAGGNPNTQRICTTCRVVKPFEAFNRMAANKSDGFQRRCRDCQSAYWKTYRPPSDRSAA